jgi:hypothetical protein
LGDISGHTEERLRLSIGYDRNAIRESTSTSPALLATLAVTRRRAPPLGHDVSHPCPDIAFAERDLAASVGYTAAFQGFGVIE